MTPLLRGIELAKMGLRIVPVHHPVPRAGGAIICSCKKGKDCTSIAKHPMPVEWQKGATNNLDLINAWISGLPKANIGVVTGAISGVFVLDVDPRHGGSDALDNLQAKHGKLPDTSMLMTGGGGYHYYFRHPGGVVKNSAGIVGNGLDIRGDAGFVVGPGSIHATGAIYDWEASSAPEETGFQPAPKWLLDLTKPKTQSAPMTRAENGSIIEGGRNVWLASIAGALRCRGCEYQALLQMLLVANEQHCRPALEPIEVDQIAKSYAGRPK